MIGHTLAGVSHFLRVSPGLLLLGVLPHAIPELIALFLPLAAWIIASRRGEWEQLLAATVVTVAVAVPVLVVAAFDRGLRLAAPVHGADPHPPADRARLRRLDRHGAVGRGRPTQDVRNTTARMLHSTWAIIAAPRMSSTSSRDARTITRVFGDVSNPPTMTPSNGSNSPLAEVYRRALTALSVPLLVESIRRSNNDRDHPLPEAAIWSIAPRFMGPRRPDGSSEYVGSAVRVLSGLALARTLIRH